jgi:hypothetical protein
MRLKPASLPAMPDRSITAFEFLHKELQRPVTAFASDLYDNPCSVSALASLKDTFDTRHLRLPQLSMLT